MKLDYELKLKIKFQKINSTILFKRKKKFMIKYFKYYFIVLNLLGFLSMYIDKEKSKANKWRIRESTLLLIALLGGSIGSYFGMKIFRHKTKHFKFKYGIPIILFIQLSIFLYMSRL